MEEAFRASQLEHAWKEAEEIAAIADKLLLPPTVHEFLTKYRA